MVREHVSFKDRRVLYYKLGQKMNNIRITRGIAKDKNKYKVQYIILIIYHEERTHAMHSSSRSQAEAIRYFRNRFTQCLEMQGEANIHKCFTSYLRNAFIILCNVFCVASIVSRKMTKHVSTTVHVLDVIIQCQIPCDSKVK